MKTSSNKSIKSINTFQELRVALDKLKLKPLGPKGDVVKLLHKYSR